MLRFRIKELILEVNRLNPNSRITLLAVADEIGVGRSTVRNLTGYSEVVTNTAIVEALARFFKSKLPSFEFSDLIEFTPPLGEGNQFRIGELYPNRAQRSAEAGRTSRADPTT